jgi:hypothetical protein
MLGLNEFEETVLATMLTGDHPVLATLREQSKHGRVANRTHSGVGFFCEFELSSDAPLVRGNFHIGDVHADLKGLAHGVGLVLFIREGRLSMLEGYTYDEPWPKNIASFTLRYSDSERKSELAKLDAHAAASA